jgi:hypothetical protein
MASFLARASNSQNDIDHFEGISCQRASLPRRQLLAGTGRIVASAIDPKQKYGE